MDRQARNKSKTFLLNKSRNPAAEILGSTAKRKWDSYTIYDPIFKKCIYTIYIFVVKYL